MLEEELLHYLMQNDQGISGPQLANYFKVSRNAIWKACESLRQQGYTISSSRAGYRLTACRTDLDPKQIRYYLANWPDLKVMVNDVVDSTNNQAKTYLSQNPDRQALFIAKKQTAGRGRYGRQFTSDLAHGIYLSLAIPPHSQNPDDIPLYTLLIATALTEVLANYVTSPNQLKIKWINDLFYQGRKVVGILCEAIADIESQSIEQLVIGCGLNLAGDFNQASPDVQKVAGTLFGSDLPAHFNLNQFIAELVNRIAYYHENLADKHFLANYQKHLMGIGQVVDFEHDGQLNRGKILGINDSGHLRIQASDGQVLTFTKDNLHLSSQQFAHD